MINVTVQEKRRQFKQRLMEKGRIIVAPGVYDAFSAKILEHVGFEAAYMTGAGVSASLVGRADLGLTTMTEMVDQARRIVDAFSLPLICDANTGYGGPLNIRRTVKQYENAGVCGLHLEDQEIPKKCGHLEGKRLVSPADMLARLKSAFDARSDENLLIIARTDARAVFGLEDALGRGQLYAEAGADVLFIEAPENLDEMRKIAETFPDVPLLINMGGYKTPPLSASELQQMGFRIVIFPGDTQKAAGWAMIEVLKVLKETGSTESFQNRMMSFKERFTILDLERLRDLESTYLQGAMKGGDQ